MTTSIRAWHLGAIIALAGAVLLPLEASAQSELDSADAEAFLGAWDLGLQTETGPLNLDLDIVDLGGKVAASLGSADQGGSQEITDISRAGDALVMSYEMNAQGQVVQVSVTLTPDGDRLNADLDFAEGMFVVAGIATRADG